MAADSTTVRFGVLGAAGIARKSVLPAIEASDHAVVAIASRSDRRAEAVAADHSIPRAYGSYERLLGDENVDAVYIPLPNALHAEWIERAADAGKDVLCEKPLTVDTAEARAVTEHCDERNVTLMEGYMYRYHPRTERAIDLVRTELADLRSVTATFRFPLYGRPDDIRLDPELAGGSLMDVGCYPVSVSRTLLGTPDRAYAHAHASRDAGVDTEFAGLLEYDDGAVARVASGFDTRTIQRYRVEATNGWIEVEEAFDCPADESLSLAYEIDDRRGVETFDPVDQYRMEVEHFAECVATGENPRTDGREAIENMRVIDALSESAEVEAPVEL